MIRSAPFRSLATLGLSALVLSCSDATGPGAGVPATMTPEAASLSFTHLGQQLPMAVEVRDETGALMTNVEVTWATDDESVAEVTGGLMRAVGNGQTRVRASAGAATTSIAVAVRQVASHVTLSESEWSFSSLGDTLRLVATVVDSGGSGMDGAAPEWSSLDASVASVSESGLVTARVNGSTTVAASIAGILQTARITVDQLPNDVVLPTDSIHFTALQDTATVVPDVRDAQGNPMSLTEMIWSTADEAVVTVSGSGRLTSVGNGSTRVTVTAGAVARDFAVGVAQGVAIVDLMADSVVLADPGDEVVAVAVAVDARGNTVSAPPLAWQSTDPSVVTVAADGTITAVGTGSTWVRVSSGAVVDSLVARVEPELILVVLGDPDPSALVDTEVSLSARVEDVLGSAYAGAAVMWTVDPGSGSIASASESESDGTGHVSAVWRLGTASGIQTARASLQSRGGTVTVAFTATAEAGAALTASLTADTVLISARGETVFLAPAYFDAFGNVTTGSGVSWLSRDPGVATAAADGLVTGMAEGTTWIVGSLSAEPADSIMVTVEMRGAITVTFDDGWRSVYDNAWPVLQAMDLPANVAVYTEATAYPGYMSETHLDELHDAGWAMVSHTVSHDSLSTLSTGELDFELRASQEWLDAREYRGSNVLVAPYHAFGDPEKVAASGYYTAARGYSANSVFPDSIVAWKPDRPFDLTGIEAEDLPYTTVDGRNRLRDLLQRTLDEGGFIDAFFHQIPVTDVADFQAVMDVVNEFRERVLTYDRLYPVWARAVF